MPPSLLTGATVVFDLDGTLIDTAPDLTAALNKALGACGYPPVQGEAVRASVAFGARAMIAEGLHQVAATDEHRTEERIDAMLADFLDHYESNIAVESVPFPGMLEALAELDAAGATLAVCTNKRELLARQLLESLGLARRFAAIAGRDTFPASKPDPLHLTETVAAAGGNARHAIMIGDSDVDIRTANAAGIPSVAVRFGYGPEDSLTAAGPGRLIGAYGELIPAIESLLAAGPVDPPLRAQS
ncbi:Phosphoglycolate phosphatase [Methyloligella halotolerans]|uniref:Phosphoglycolate phosphatase n=1 Tax=Methyloligella halotolerans TaxID=1177755 RepID=A0A1E2RWN2_9HYPH|nr:HAD-IA family hydrolase [Methyloligella halotolerans]ODA66562.1 Phosphoglycolate phosphatase [Methyloligella halotolerans]